jgi:hypothetical protein
MLNPALAAAILGVSAWRKLIYSLIWQSVTWRPGKLQFLIGVKNPLPIRPTAIARKHGPLRGRAVRQIRTSVGLRPPFVAHPATVSHPNRRALLISSVAQQLTRGIARPRPRGISQRYQLLQTQVERPVQVAALTRETFR